MSATDRPGHLSALATRLILLVAVVFGTGLLLGALFLPSALAMSDMVNTVRRDVLDVPPIGDADPPVQNSFVYAADGSEIAELTFEENRVPVALEDIPQDTVNAVLATEDAEFYRHNGVNHGAMLRAMIINLRSGGIEQGASTITQQYVKDAYLSAEQTYARKIKEALYAIEVEEQLDKHEILERYLNRAYFGSGVYGIGTAAQRYFSKQVGDLTLSESAMLAGLLRSPERNNPISSPDNALTRRNIVLRQMAQHGFVSRAQADAAMEEDLGLNPSEPSQPDTPFWVDWVSRLLINEATAQSLGSQVDALEAMGDTVEERTRRVFQSGLRIHTTLDPELQEMAEAALLAHLTYEDEPAEEVAQEPLGAIVSIDPETGAILTMALGPRKFGSCAEDGGWVGEDDAGRLLCDKTKVNPAVRGMGGSGRQPGSSFKPFLIAAALEDGLPPTLTMDATGPQEIEGCVDGPGGQWTVRNAGGDGVLDMYEAVQRSSNVYHALLVAEIGPDKLVEVAQRLGVRSSDLPRECSLALGAADVSPLEMASAYATLANRGTYCAPFPISRIEDDLGRVIWEHSPNCERVLDTEIADRVVDIMQGPVSTGGTAPVANLGRWPTRGKTGTTNDYRDAWFVGYIKQMATAAWIGYENGRTHFASLEQAQAVCPQGEELEEPSCLEGTKFLTNVRVAGRHYARIFGGTIPAPMWKTYMEQAVQRYEPQPFNDPGPLPTGTVPNLLATGSVSAAEQLAQEAGFRLVTQTVTHWRPAGTFVGQSPAPGEEAPLGSRITLEISDGEGTAPQVPDVVGLTFEEAVQILDEQGYESAYREVPVDDPAHEGIVVGQSPPGGTEADPEDVVVVIDVGVYQEPAEEDGDGGDEDRGRGPGDRGPPGRGGDEGDD